MRDLLEKEIVADARQGDTTVLAEILNKVDDGLIFASLSDDNQALVGKIDDFLDSCAMKSDEHNPKIVARMLESNYQVRYNDEYYYVSKNLTTVTNDEAEAYGYLFKRTSHLNLVD